MNCIKKDRKNNDKKRNALSNLSDQQFESHKIINGYKMYEEILGINYGDDYKEDKHFITNCVQEISNELAKTEKKVKKIDINYKS